MKTEMDAMIERAIDADNGEMLRACVNNLLRSAARGDEWAPKLLFERLDNATPSE